jgi:tetratricopeptide (TPR) repeat protein
MNSPALLRAAPLLLILALGTVDLRAQIPSRAPSSFSLQVNGQVRYGGSRRPAENVLVRIENFSGGLVAQLTTDRNGKFSFTGLEPKQYIVTVRAPGYLDLRENVNLATANTSYLNLELIEDRDSIGNRDRNRPTPGDSPVIDSRVPLEAQREFAQAKTILDKNNRDKFKESARHLEKAVAVYPQYLEAQLLLGLVYMDLQLWDKAEAPLRAAIEINPTASTAYFALGEDYRRLKKLTEAEKTLVAGIKIHEKSADGHFNLAKVYWDMASAAVEEQAVRSNFEKSWQEITQTLALDPRLAEAHILAGNLLLRARRAKEALSHFEAYLQLAPAGEFAGQAEAMVRKIKKALAETVK